MYTCFTHIYDVKFDHSTYYTFTCLETLVTTHNVLHEYACESMCRLGAAPAQDGKHVIDPNFDIYNTTESAGINTTTAPLSLQESQLTMTPMLTPKKTLSGDNTRSQP